jgi:hypothetical protein
MPARLRYIPARAKTRTPPGRRRQDSALSSPCWTPDWAAGRTINGRIDFARVNCAALGVLPVLLARWLPGGRTEGPEYVVLNPRRVDRRSGSFRINMRTGRWADFAVDGARGGDPISLAAYLRGIGQVEAAARLAGMLGIKAHDAR